MTGNCCSCATLVVAILSRALAAFSEIVMPARKDHSKSAEEAQARLAAIVTSSADAIVGKTLDGTVTNWNEAAERMFGWSASEMIGQSIRRLIPADRTPRRKRSFPAWLGASASSITR
jgi:PAS domain-containing protein